MKEEYDTIFKSEEKIAGDLVQKVFNPKGLGFGIKVPILFFIDYAMMNIFPF